LDAKAPSRVTFNFPENAPADQVFRRKQRAFGVNKSLLPGKFNAEGAAAL
jgi:hypothetical protein